MIRRSMSTSQRLARGVRSPSLPFRGDTPSILLIMMLAVLWIAGGASRPDVMGQVVVRIAAWLALIATALFGRRPSFAGQSPVVALTGIAILIPLLQLIPLPPDIWQNLPGRTLFAQAILTGEPQPWRPISLVPGATMNALGSLVVPATILILLAQLRDDARDHLPGFLLALVATAAILAMLQFSTRGLDNPLINETVGQISGPFANRNHFALLMAIGCALAPAWAFRRDRQTKRRMTWRPPVSLALVLLFLLLILGSGSRAGLLLAAIGLCGGLAMVQKDVRHALARYPRWAFPAVLTGIVGIFAIFVLISISTDRAVSIARLLSNDGGQDMRRRALPIVLQMVRDHFPVGSGMGSFDPIFRISEPFDLLKLTFFNHAHNDFLEVMLNAGIIGGITLLAASGWWAMASIRAWRGHNGRDTRLPRLGSTILLLIAVASLFDYPARTPLIMAIVVIAATWLAGTTVSSLGTSALPKRDEHL